MLVETWGWDFLPFYTELLHAVLNLDDSHVSFGQLDAKHISGRSSSISKWPQLAGAHSGVLTRLTRGYFISRRSLIDRLGFYQLYVYPYSMSLRRPRAVHHMVIGNYSMAIYTSSRGRPKESNIHGSNRMLFRVTPWSYQSVKYQFHLNYWQWEASYCLVLKKFWPRNLRKDEVSEIETGELQHR